MTQLSDHDTVVAAAPASAAVLLRVRGLKLRGRTLALLTGGGGLVLLVLALLALDGVLLYLLQRRLQGAADAAAQAAALKLRASAVVTDLQVAAEFGRALVASGFNENAPGSTARAVYLDAHGAEAGEVGGGALPAGAIGVRVMVAGARTPLLLTPLGTAAATTVSATASAGMTNLATIAERGTTPFILCGTRAVRLSGNSKTVVTDLLDTSTTPPSLNPAYKEAYFVLHDAQLDQDGGSCGKGSIWRGLGDSSDADRCAALPCAWDISGGLQAGAARTRVAGQPGCDDNLATGCLLVVPIAVEEGGGCARLTSNQVCVVTWGLFKIIQSTATLHTGQLLDGSRYIVTSGAAGRRAPPASCTLCPKVIGLLD